MQTSSPKPLPLAVVVAFVVMSVLPRWSVAQSESDLPPEVVEAAERGRQLFDEERYDEAIEFLNEAYATYEEAIFLQYIGRCHQELEQFCDAADNYRRFLRQGNPPQQVRDQLEARLDELDERCEDEREPAPDERRPPVYDDDPNEGPPRRFGGEVEPRGSAPDHRRTDIAAYVLFGVGGAALIPGVVLWIAALTSHARSENWTLARVQQEVPDADEVADIWYRFATPGDILGVPGAVMIAAGLIVLIVGRRRARNQALSSLTLTPGPGEAGLGLTFSWP